MEYIGFVKALLPIFGLLLLFPMMAYLAALTEGRFTMEKMSDDEADNYLAGLSSEREWAEGKDFEFVGCYVHHYSRRHGRGSMEIAAWRQRETPRFFYLTGANPHLTTLFADRVDLTTAEQPLDSPSSLPPGVYEQQYSGKSLEKFWERHLEGENYLRDVGGAEMGESDMWFEEWLVENWNGKQTYKRSIPFWPFRTYGWFFRFLTMHYASIQKQHERGWIRLPNEIQSKRLT